MTINIAANQVKTLREMTGVGMMECKKALIETNGDLDKAIIWLREHGMARAAKKSERVASQGMIDVQVSKDRKSAVIMELNCETDFVAKNDDFIRFVKSVSELALAKNAKTTDELNAQKMSDGHTVKDALTNLIAKIGENMQLRRVQHFAVQNGFITGYIHFGNKIGTVVVIEGPVSAQAEEIGKDVAMHVAAANPKYLCPSCVSKEELEQEKEISRKKLADQKKPANILEKIVEGQMAKFYKEVCLLEQGFVKDPDTSIQGYIKQSSLPIKITAFARFQVGEGTEKKSED